MWSRGQLRRHYGEEKPDIEIEIPDIEIARYALRTFDLSKGRLGSLYRNHAWDGGTAVARCLRADDPCPVVPGDNCHCGLYGTLTLQELVNKYPKARRCVAVFAAEGSTIIGDRGLRTAAARIVAYWLEDSATGRHKIFAENCPQARYFADMKEMLSTFGFPPMDNFLSLHNPDWEMFTQGAGTWVVPDPASASAPVLKPTHWDLTIAPLMTAASPQGLAVVKDLLGVPID